MSNKAPVTRSYRNPLAALIRTASDIRPHEMRPALVSFAIVFILMASYFVLRPVRDAMASDWTDSEVSFLWNINFFVSAGIVALYGAAVSRIRVAFVVPLVYGFFATAFGLFYLTVTALADRDLVDKIFYVWVSVYALFHVSVFWTLMADTYTREQAKRLFAVIGAGASAGALVGPAIPALFASRLGTDELMLVATSGLCLILPLVVWLVRLKSTDLGNAGLRGETEQAIIGGRWWQGFSGFAANPYLLGIAAFILLYVFINSFVYFEQKNLLADYSRADRAGLLGRVDWVVNVLTFGIALFATGRIATRFGMAVTLALMPVLVVAGLAVLALAPVVTVVLALQVVRRAGNYAVTRPAREMLYTRVTRQERFKAKPVIDIVVYRGGDALSSSVFAWLTDGLGLGLAAVAAVGAAIAAVWAWLGARLGFRYDHDEETRESRVRLST